VIRSSENAGPELPEIEKPVVFRFTGKSSHGPGTVLAFRTEAVAESGEHLFYECLSSDHRAVAEVADLAA
jgi:hypothetical protein